MVTSSSNVTVAMPTFTPGTTATLEALTLQKQTSDTRNIALTLDALASTAATSGFPDRAARLLGATDRLRDAERMPRSVGAQAEHDRTLGLARAGLEESAFEAAFAAGREINLDEAMAEGLEAIRRPTESRYPAQRTGDPIRSV
jgi:cell division septum initiation protein DivIVA